KCIPPSPRATALKILRLKPDNEGNRPMVCRRRCVPCVLMNTKTWHSRDSVRRMRYNSRQWGREWKGVEALPGERRGHGRAAGAPTVEHCTLFHVAKSRTYTT